jgi:serine kinase of HPr protein (carbohydrate metabolism regulator)
MSSMISSETRHVSCVAIGGFGVLIAGPSGSGKSDLSLRLIDRGATLVSDDYTIITRSDGALFASAPTTIKGKIEVRGLGLIEIPNIDHIPISLFVSLEAQSERYPFEDQSEIILGLKLRKMISCPFEASAPIKVELALRQGFSQQ